MSQAIAITAGASRPSLHAEQLLNTLRGTVLALVRSATPDLTARQLGVFLVCYLEEGPHTVRGLAAHLNVSKPAITRALDRLGELELVRRKIDPFDRRSVLTQRTLKGAAFMRELRDLMIGAAGDARLPSDANRPRHPVSIGREAPLRNDACG